MTCPLLHDRVEVGVQLLDGADTCVPTSTVSTAWSVPVAATASTTSPRVTGMVVTFGSGA